DARPSDEIIDQVDWAAHASMERKAFGSAFVFDQLSQYIQQSQQFNDDLWDRIDILARRATHHTTIDTINIRREIALRSSDFLRELALDLSKSGRTGALSLIFEELNDRVARKTPQGSGNLGDERWVTARALAVVVALARLPV